MLANNLEMDNQQPRLLTHNGDEQGSETIPRKGSTLHENALEMVDNLNKLIYIYTLTDPITFDIRYVGITARLKERYRQHICTTFKHLTHTKAWIKGLKMKNLLPIMEVIEVTTEENCEWLEKYWISQFKCWGFNLTNLTIGGEGINGFKHSIEARLKITKAGLGRIPSKKSITALNKYNKNKSIQHRINHSKAMKGKIPPNKGVPMTDEQKLLLSKLKQGKPAIWKYIKVLQLDLNDNLIAEWDSATIAAKELNLTRANIVAVLKGRRKMCGNCKWIYKN